MNDRDLRILAGVYLFAETVNRITNYGLWILSLLGIVSALVPPRKGQGLSRKHPTDRYMIHLMSFIGFLNMGIIYYLTVDDPFDLVFKVIMTCQILSVLKFFMSGICKLIIKVSA